MTNCHIMRKSYSNHAFLQKWTNYCKLHINKLDNVIHEIFASAKGTHQEDIQRLWSRIQCLLLDDCLKSQKKKLKFQKAFPKYVHESDRIHNTIIATIQWSMISKFQMSLLCHLSSNNRGNGGCTALVLKWHIPHIKTWKLLPTYSCL